jgi:hypothetical protein
MISLMKMTAARPAAARGLSAACGLSGARLRGAGVSGVQSARRGVFAVVSHPESVTTGFSKIDKAGWLIERPAKAPAAAAAQAVGYAIAANGARLGEPTLTTQQYQTMRAFRGLEPWRDPA